MYYGFSVFIHTANMKRPSIKSSESKEQLVGNMRSKSGRLLPMPVTVSGVSCVSFFWLLFTFLLICGLIIAGGFPNWIVNRVERSPVRNPQRNEIANALDSVELGLFYLCFNLTACPDDFCSEDCQASGYCGCHTYMTFNPASNYTLATGRSTPTSIRPLRSIVQIQYLFSASIIYAAGILILIISLLFGILAFCKPRVRGCSIFVVAFIFQIFAGNIVQYLTFNTCIMHGRLIMCWSIYSLSAY